jgi:hypothetical protein
MLLLLLLLLLLHNRAAAQDLVMLPLLVVPSALMRVAFARDGHRLAAAFRLAGHALALCAATWSARRYCCY